MKYLQLAVVYSYRCALTLHDGSHIWCIGILIYYQLANNKKLKIPGVSYLIVHDLPSSVIVIVQYLLLFKTSLNFTTFLRLVFFLYCSIKGELSLLDLPFLWGRGVIETSSSWEMNGVFLKLSVLQFLGTLYILHILNTLLYKYIALSISLSYLWMYEFIYI